MKNLAKLLLATTIMITSCSKNEEITKKDCNCGLITDDDNGTINGESWYSVNIRNSCSGNVKTFYLTKGDWMGAHAGNNHCILNETW